MPVLAGVTPELKVSRRGTVTLRRILMGRYFGIMLR